MKIAIAGILATFTSATAVMSQAQSCPCYSSDPLGYLYYTTGRNAWYIDQLWSKVNEAHEKIETLTPKVNFFRTSALRLSANDVLDEWCVDMGDTVEIFA